MDASSPEGCAREILDGIPPVIWFIRREMRVFRKGLSLAQFRTLARIQRQPSASLSVVAEHLGSSLPTASRIVQGLVQQELLARKGCAEDRRQLCLVLTEKGENVLKTAWAGTQGRLKAKLAGMEPSQLESITEAMQLLKGVFGELGLCEILKPVNGTSHVLPTENVAVGMEQS